MKIEEIKSQIEKNKKIRDTLIDIKIELEELSKNESVRRYIELKKYYDDNFHFVDKTDEQLSNEVIYSNDVDDKKYYFCYGKNFIGQCNKMGRYYIVKDKHPFIKKYGITVALYRNIFNKYDEVILPIEKCDEFEKNNNIVFCKTLNPDSEYLDLKKEYYTLEMKKILK